MQATTTTYQQAAPAQFVGAPQGWPDIAHLEPTCHVPVKELHLSKKVTRQQHTAFNPACGDASDAGFFGD